MPSGLAPRRPPGRVRRVEERRHCLGEVAQGLLLDRLGAGRQPRVLPSRLGELSASLPVARRARPAAVPVPLLLDGEVPYVPGVSAVVSQHRLLAGAGAAGTGTYEHTIDTPDISGGEAAFLPA